VNPRCGSFASAAVSRSLRGDALQAISFDDLGEGAAGCCESAVPTGADVAIRLSRDACEQWNQPVALENEFWSTSSLGLQ